METLEDLQAILNGAPDDGKAVEVCFYDYGEDMALDYLNCENEFYDPEEKIWIDKLLVDNYFHTYRRIADIQRIVDLMTCNKEMHKQVNGYLHGDDWEHWQAFNQKRFLL